MERDSNESLQVTAGCQRPIRSCFRPTRCRLHPRRSNKAAAGVIRPPRCQKLLFIASPSRLRASRNVALPSQKNVAADPDSFAAGRTMAICRFIILGAASVDATHVCESHFRVLTFPKREMLFVVFAFRELAWNLCLLWATPSLPHRLPCGDTPCFMALPRLIRRCRRRRWRSASY